MARYRLWKKPIILVACVPTVFILFANAPAAGGHAEYEKNITVTMKALKDVYDLGEPVPLVLTVENHGIEPVYSLTSESELLNGYARVKDANGTLIRHGPIPDPTTPPPSYYYMDRGGKKVFTVPLYEIPPGGVRTLRMKDALRLHHKYVSEGTYFLFWDYIQLLHDVEKAIIIREGLPEGRLWIDPGTKLATRVRHKINTVKIQIKKGGAKEPEPFAPAWAYLLAFVLIAIAATGIAVFLKRRAANINRTQ